MADTALQDFVREALAKGESRAAVEGALLKAGWPADQVGDALAAFADVEFSVPVPRPRRFGSAREAFLYIVYFALLGMVAVHVGGLAFAWVDTLFADPVFREGRGGARALRWAVASLLVGYPIFLYLGWRLGRERRRDPERRTSRIRAWLTYVTLIFAATALIGDLVAVVYRFLDGELGARFLLKAFVVAAISGAILVNFTREAERTSGEGDRVGRAIAGLATLAAAVLVAWAFTVVNSPGAARARAADEARLRDLGTLARLVDCHRTEYGETPAALNVIEMALQEQIEKGEPFRADCNAALPKDPAGAAYGYRPLDGDRFEICASFARGWPALEPNERRRRIGARVAGERRFVNLPDGSGEACFEFTARDLAAERDNE